MFETLPPSSRPTATGTSGWRAAEREKNSSIQQTAPAVSTAMGFFGLNAVAAGRALISLSESYSRPRIDRVSLQHRIERALRASCEATTPVRQPRRDTIIKFQTEPMYLRDIGLFT